MNFSKSDSDAVITTSNVCDFESHHNSKERIPAETMPDSDSIASFGSIEVGIEITHAFRFEWPRNLSVSSSRPLAFVLLDSLQSAITFKRQIE